MLEKCLRDQWRVEDLDWSRPPPPMSRDKEEAIVQYFTDMSGIERLAAALFEEQGRRATDPVLREIFASFVADELRHSAIALRQSPALTATRANRSRGSPRTKVSRTSVLSTAINRRA